MFLDIFIHGGFFICYWIFVFLLAAALTYARAGGKPPQSFQVHPHFWFNSVTVVAEWICKRIRRTCVCPSAIYNLFWRQYVCIVSIQVAKRDSVRLDTENSTDFHLTFRDRKGLCGSETWRKFSKRKAAQDPWRLTRAFVSAGRTVRAAWEQHIVLPGLCLLQPLFRARSRSQEIVVILYTFSDFPDTILCTCSFKAWHPFC